MYVFNSEVIFLKQVVAIYSSFDFYGRDNAQFT